MVELDRPLALELKEDLELFEVLRLRVTGLCAITVSSSTSSSMSARLRTLSLLAIIVLASSPHIAGQEDAREDRDLEL